MKEIVPVTTPVPTGNEDIILMKAPIEASQITVTDKSGEEATLVVYMGELIQMFNYQEFGKAGYLSNVEGDLIDM
jgi:hypothetical protein